MGLFFMSSAISFAQPSGNCDPNTPFFNVNLSSAPNGTWTSSPFPRVGNCCGTVAPDKCLEFKITLSPQAIAINFQIVSGAVPPGALYYQIDCGPPVAVGSPICLNGPGPYTLTFCKPGNNINSYAINSIAAPAVSPDDTIGNGCSTVMSTSGLLVNSSITWTSIFPGSSGAYNSYLSCTSGCETTTVTAQSGAPAYVDYVVCGQPLAGACASSALFCDTIRIHFSPPIINTINPNPAAFCANNPSGVVLTGNVNGGVPPYTFAWTNGSNGSGTVVGSGLTYTATLGGNYSLIVYDKNYPGCPPQITNVTVTVSPTPTISAGPDQTLCGTTVYLNGTVLGATGGIWSGGNGSYSPNNTTPNAVYTPSSAELSAGTIILTFSSTGNGACASVADQVILKIVPPLVVNLTAPPVVCFGQTANIISNVTGGFLPYTYNWSNGQTSSSLYNIGPGTYSLTVSSLSGIGCNASVVATIASNPQIIVNTSPNNSVACGTFAVISASASGGTGALTYQWSNGATGSSTNVYSGTYSVIVTDAVGCIATNAVSVIASNSALVLTVNQPTTLCNGATTTLNAFANGGFGGYTYQWSNGSSASSIVVGGGNYCVTVTDGGGCIASACANIVQSTVINVSINQPPPICNGASANVNANVIGGQGPYNYSWSNGQTSSVLVAPAGNYGLIITDAIGCTKTATLSIIQSPPINAVVNATSTSCFGSNDGLANTSVVGGTQPYYYSWFPYGGASNSASGLLAGSFSVTITDAIGCSKTSVVTINQPPLLNVTTSINNNVSCYGGNNGSATAIPSGGTAGYSYLWTPSGSTSQTPVNLVAGNYLVSVTDSKGCFQSSQATITEPTFALTGSIVSTSNVLCAGGSSGSATVTGVGGTAPYSYQWVPFGGSSAIGNNLSLGTYTVNITDAKLCVTKQLVTISQPIPLTATLSLINNVSCFGGSNGSANVSVNGGTAPYFYSWNSTPTQTTQIATNLPVGSYSVLVTDSKNCTFSSAGITLTQPTVLSVSVNPSALTSCSAAISITSAASGGSSPYSYLWTNGSNTSNISVYAGSYTVTATDILGCKASNTVSILTATNNLTATINQPAAICYGSSTTITVTANGGFGGYSYMWDNSSTSITQTVTVGSHCVNVTDAGGCIVSACVNIIQNQLLQATIAAPSLVCPLGKTTLSVAVTGGQTPYNYLWNTGVTTNTLLAGVGNYTITVSDGTGLACSVTKTIAVAQEPALVVSTASTNVSCYGGNNGTASVYVSGGVSNYSYLWSVNNASTSIVGGLAIGNYSVVITDNIGCKKTVLFSISQPNSPISIITTNTTVTCSSSSNGVLSASSFGGSSPYYYYWDPTGVSTATVTGLSAGVYTVLVADTTGCYSNATATVSSPAPITISSTTISSTCGYSNASATVTANGGGGAYTYSWSPTGTTSPILSNVNAGTYTMIVTDNLGCAKNTVIVLPSRLSTAVANFGVSTACINQPSVFSDLSLNGNDVISFWSWDFNDPLSGSNNFSALQNPTHIYSSSGNYYPILTIQTQLGCFKTFTLNVPFYPTPMPSFIVGNVCAQSSVSFTNTSTISSGAITSYNWTFGDLSSGTSNMSVILNPVHYYALSGIYTVSLTVTSNNNCKTSASSVVNINPLPVTSFVAANGCVNTNTQFTNASSSYTKWQWNFGDSSPIDSIVVSPAHVFSVSGTYSVTLTSINSFNCKSSDTLVITVSPLPMVNFVGQTACLNKPVSFTDLSSISSGSISTYSWDFGDFSSSTIKNPFHGFATSGTYYVSETVTSDVGCSATSTKTISVFPLPVANFSLTNACLNASAQFTDYSTTGTGSNISNWLWAFGDGSPINNTQNPQHVYAVANSYTVTLVVTNNVGCKDTIRKPLIITPVPIVSFTIDDTSGCATFCPKFKDASTPTGLLTNWIWNFGDNTSFDNSQNPVHCYTIAGSYPVVLQGITANGCKVTSSQSTAITLNPNPVASFSYTPHQVLSSSPQINFTNTSSNAVIWTWYFGDGSSSTSDSNLENLHTYDKVGEFCATLVVFNEYGCRDEASGCLTVESDFAFYIPNAFTPDGSKGTNDFFTVFGLNIAKFKMWIFDRWGENIFYTEDIQTGWDGRAKNSSEKAKQDVYTWKVELTDYNDNLYKKVGHVTLLK